MIQSRVPKIFYKFADNVRDATPNYELIKRGDDPLGPLQVLRSNRQPELLELATCLRQMLGGQFTDEELNRFYTASDANIKYSDPSLLRAFLDDAVVIVERELT